MSSNAAFSLVANSVTGTWYVTGRIATVFRLKLFLPNSAPLTSRVRVRESSSRLTLWPMILEILIVISGYRTEIALNRVIGIRVSSESRMACRVELRGVAVMQSTAQVSSASSSSRANIDTYALPRYLLGRTLLEFPPRLLRLSLR